MGERQIRASSSAASAAVQSLVQLLGQLGTAALGSVLVPAAPS